ncbi:hypothetical protein ACFVJI_19300 [Streptomyces sp. NPDC127584]|uniref:hypothetical protein n=1 Tax=Streptomyces sp. NPDC127584 TaxID=3345403 RepID=UPI0036305865
MEHELVPPARRTAALPHAHRTAISAVRPVTAAPSLPLLAPVPGRTPPPGAISRGPA